MVHQPQVDYAAAVAAVVRLVIYGEAHTEGWGTAIEDDPPVRYRTIVADPPWDLGRTGFNYEREGAQRKSRIPYASMSSPEIAALPISEMAAADAHLYLWTTQRFLFDARAMVDAWGFRYSCALIWCKRPVGMGMGGMFSSTVEFVLFAWRGETPATGVVDRQWFEWPRGEHSAKPEAFMDIVEQVSPGPYLELFARRQRLGWDTWGNEALDHTNGALGGNADAQHGAGVPASPKGGAQ